MKKANKQKKMGTQQSERRSSASEMVDRNRRRKIHTKGPKDTKVHLYQLTLVPLPAFAPSHRKEENTHTQSRDSRAKNRNLAFPAKVLSTNHGWLSGICDTDGTFRTPRSVVVVVNMSGTLANSVCASQMLSWV